MTEQTIIHSAAAVAPTLEEVLAGITTGQSLSCRFDESLGLWCCDVWGPAASWTADLYGTGNTLAAAIADLHPPQRMKQARPADPGQWTTEDPE